MSYLLKKTTDLRSVNIDGSGATWKAQLVCQKTWFHTFSCSGKIFLLQIMHHFSDNTHFNLYNYLQVDENFKCTYFLFNSLLTLRNKMIMQWWCLYESFLWCETPSMIQLLGESLEAISSLDNAKLIRKEAFIHLGQWIRCFFYLKNAFLCLYIKALKGSFRLAYPSWCRSPEWHSVERRRSF